MYYKNVRKLADGRRVSQFIDTESSYAVYGKMLEYKSRQVTTAPKRSHGIYCYDNLWSAKDLVNGNTCTLFTGVVEVHEAYPIGECRFGKCFPAIKLGKIVARYTVYKGYTHGYKG